MVWASGHRGHYGKCSLSIDAQVAEGPCRGLLAVSTARPQDVNEGGDAATLADKETAHIVEGELEEGASRRILAARGPRDEKAYLQHRAGRQRPRPSGLDATYRQQQSCEEAQAREQTEPQGGAERSWRKQQKGEEKASSHQQRRSENRVDEMVQGGWEGRGQRKWWWHRARGEKGGHPTRRRVAPASVSFARLSSSTARFQMTFAAASWPPGLAGSPSSLTRGGSAPSQMIASRVSACRRAEDLTRKTETDGGWCAQVPCYAQIQRQSGVFEGKCGTMLARHG